MTSKRKNQQEGRRKVRGLMKKTLARELKRGDRTALASDTMRAPRRGYGEGATSA